MCLNKRRSSMKYCVNVVTKRSTLESRDFVARRIIAVPLIPRASSSNTPAVTHASQLWGQNINFLQPKICNPNPPIINYDQWSLRLNFCLTLNSDSQAIFTGSRCTNEPRGNIATRANLKLYRMRQQKVMIFQIAVLMNRVECKK